MMAQMLPPNPRVSQNLPIPKCSTCGQFVPLEELGEHICAKPPPLPKPAPPPPVDVNALLPKRLQGRVPSRNRRGSPSRSASRSPPLSIDISSSALTRPQGGDFRARTPSATAQPTSATSRDTPTTARPSLTTPRGVPANPRPTPSPVSPPRNTPPNQLPPFPIQGRGPTPLGYKGPPQGLSIPPIRTQSNMLPRNMVPPRDTSSPSPQRSSPGTVGPGARIPETLAPRQSLVPPPERGIHTMTGGEAGMAGVGRRGFAAVARAAMLGLPDRNLRPQPQMDSNQSRYLDIDAQSRQPGNSPSPEPTSPLPQSEVATQSIVTRTPSPLNRTPSAPIPPESVKYSTSDTMSANSPIGTRLPFFEKFRNKIPGNNTSTANNDSSISNPSNSTSILRKKTIDSLNRSTTSSSTSSRPLKDVRRPISPINSESDYGGLAYADSIDNDGERSRSRSKNSSRPGMPDLVLRTGSSSSGRRRQPSGSDLSEYSNDRPSIMIGSTIPRLNRSRTPSASSISGSEDEPSTRARANSAAAIAHALGLSQTPPSDYGKMGGPGVMGGRRTDSSVSRRNADPDSLEEMEKALEEAKVKTRNKQSSFGSSSQQSLLYRADTSSSIATSRKGDNVIENGGGVVKAQRSNTIQSANPTSSVKLPMRSLTSPKFDRDKALDGTGVRKERVRKSRVCLKCLKVIANERWVSVDAGVLCERCWKNMYLPKCRRCNVSIEKQAVSSSDGQLKGKYHKECFNCDTCHKPFPDKSFYVYDGKPLCAYHYHEANNSLCAAARCGQPVEGPCAVSHSGDRYHPEHMTCEHSGYPPCKQMLSEYWEIDGKMLCERHANSASVRGSDVEDEEWTKSKRRVTRFVDLTGGIEEVGSKLR